MISIVIGTRPEIIKMSPVIRASKRTGTEFSVLHTGQHYSYEMDRIFFQELELPEPQYNLDVGSGTHAVQTARILTGIENIYLSDPPDIVLVQGDTNTVLAGALAASKLHIPVGHVEAGLRSFDRTMPEEINRIVADHIADYLFAPTELSRQYLINEGIDTKKISVTGNTVVDAVFQNRRIAKKNQGLLREWGLSPGKYLLVTVHRAENVDNKSRLAGIMRGIERVAKEWDLPVLFPVHPRTRKMMQEFGINAGDISLIQPVGYLEFLGLETDARLILTDSGGVQEEACILNVPCVTLRENTERPETLTAGANLLAGTDAGKIQEISRKMMNSRREWKNPYGDGKAAERIVRICRKQKPMKRT
jgi:UDP-N-acetylglucosamine 2-epimerase (non-hydrolysing)